MIIRKKENSSLQENFKIHYKIYALNNNNNKIEYKSRCKQQSLFLRIIKIEFLNLTVRSKHTLYYIHTLIELK